MLRGLEFVDSEVSSSSTEDGFPLMYIIIASVGGGFSILCSLYDHFSCRHHCYCHHRRCCYRKEEEERSFLLESLSSVIYIYVTGCISIKT